MFVITSGGAHECTSAKQYSDGVHLLDEDDNIILIITNPRAITDVRDGEIIIVDTPESSETDTDIFNTLAAACREGVNSI